MGILAGQTDVQRDETGKSRQLASAVDSDVDGKFIQVRCTLELVVMRLAVYRRAVTIGALQAMVITSFAAMRPQDMSGPNPENVWGQLLRYASFWFCGLSFFWFALLCYLREPEPTVLIAHPDPPRNKSADRSQGASPAS